MKAISIRQPWAWLIIHAGKDIENREWPTRYRGKILIHASKGMTLDEYADARDFAEDIRPDIVLPYYKTIERGGIVGECEIVDCITRSQSPWFGGTFGFVLRNVKALPFQPCKGQLGIFDMDPPRTEAISAELFGDPDAIDRAEYQHGRKGEP